MPNTGTLVGRTRGEAFVEMARWLGLDASSPQAAAEALIGAEVITGFSGPGDLRLDETFNSLQASIVSERHEDLSFEPVIAPGDVDWDAVASYVQFRQTVLDRFPSWSWTLDHPELGPLLKQAAGEEEWSPQVFESQLRATDWWQSRTAAQRDWDIFIGSAGEADVDRRIDEAMGQMRDDAGRLGADFSDDELRDLTIDALRNGWSADEVTGQIVARAGNLGPGDLTAAQTMVQSAARDFMVDVDDGTARDLATRVVTNELNQAGVVEYMRNIARQRWVSPQITEMLDQNITMREYFQPHRQLIAQMLGRAVEQVDLANEFRPVISLRDGDTVAPMSLGQVDRYVRTLDEFWDAGAGRDEKFNMARGLARHMGVIR